MSHTVFQGDAYAARVIATGTRHFAVRLVNDDSAPANRSGYIQNAGSLVTLYFRTWTTGGLPPEPASTVEIHLFYENESAAQVSPLKILQSGAPPANGTSYAVYLTSDFLANSAARCGTLRLRIRAVRTPNEIAPYTIDSDDDTDSNTHKGYLVSRPTASLIDRNAYPSGDKYAHGPTADESVIITTTHTRPWKVLGHEKFKHRFEDSTTPGSYVDTAQDTVENEAAGQSRKGRVFDYGFAQALRTYASLFWVEGNSPLTGALWTNIATSGHGSGYAVVGTQGVKRSSHWQGDPRVTLTHASQGVAPRRPAGPHFAHFVVDEMTLYSWVHAKNARDQNIGAETGVIAWELRKPDTTLHASATRSLGADGWSTQEVSAAVVAPVGAWTNRMKYTRGATVQTTDQTLRFDDTPGPRRIVIVGPSILSTGRRADWYARTQYDGVAATPTSQPAVLVRRLPRGTVAFTDDLDESMLNSVDKSASINGALYEASHVPGGEGRCFVAVVATVHDLLMVGQHEAVVNPPVMPHLHDGIDQPRIEFTDIDGLTTTVISPIQKTILEAEDTASQTEHDLMEAAVVERDFDEALFETRAATLLADSKDPHNEIVFSAWFTVRPVPGDILRLRDRGLTWTIRAVDDLGGGRFRVRAGSKNDQLQEWHRLRRQRLDALERYA